MRQISPRERELLDEGVSSKQFPPQNISSFDWFLREKCIPLGTKPNSLFEIQGYKFYLKKTERDGIGVNEAKNIAVVAKHCQDLRVPPCIPLLVEFERMSDAVYQVCESVGVSFDDWMLRKEGAELFAKASKGDTAAATLYGKIVESVCAQVILILYCLQLKVLFSHNDLHTKNVMVTFDGQVKSFEVDVFNAEINAFERKKFVFWKDMPSVRLIDFGISTHAAPETKQEFDLHEDILSNSYNNSFDVIRFLTTVALCRKGGRNFWGEHCEFFTDATKQLIKRASADGGFVSDLFSLSKKERSYCEQFPVHMGSMTPLSILERDDEELLKGFADAMMPNHKTRVKLEHHPFLVKERRSRDAGIREPWNPVLTPLPWERDTSYISLRLMTSLKNFAHITSEEVKSRVEKNASVLWFQNANTMFKKRYMWRKLVELQRTFRLFFEFERKGVLEWNDNLLHRDSTVPIQVFNTALTKYKNIVLGKWMIASERSVLDAAVPAELLSVKEAMELSNEAYYRAMRISAERYLYTLDERDALDFLHLRLKS